MKNNTIFALMITCLAGIAFLAVQAMDSSPPLQLETTRAAPLAGELTAEVTEGADALDSVAPLADVWISANVEGAAPTRIAVLTSLGLAIKSDDGELAGQVAVEFFAQGSGALPTLLELGTTDGLSPEETRALGLLFRVATHRLVHQPERLAPWTIDSFATASLELLGAHTQVPSVLYTGFCDMGVHLDPAQLPALLDAFRSREVGSAAGSQFPCLELGKRWAKAMDTSVEPLLHSRLVDREISGSLRADAAAMLLARDWRRAASQIAVDVHSEGFSSPKALKHVACSYLLQLDTFDQAQYFELLGGSSELATAMAAQMDPAAAAIAAENLAEDREAQLRRGVLRLRAGTFDGADEVFETLNEPGLEGCQPEVTLMALEALMNADAAFEERVSERLVERFFTTPDNKDSLFRALIRESRSMAEPQLFAVVLPLLDQTSGDDHPGRAALVTTVTKRYPELRFD